MQEVLVSPIMGKWSHTRLGGWVRQGFVTHARPSLHEIRKGHTGIWTPPALHDILFGRMFSHWLPRLVSLSVESVLGIKVKSCYEHDPAFHWYPSLVGQPSWVHILAAPCTKTMFSETNPHYQISSSWVSHGASIRELGYPVQHNILSSRVFLWNLYLVLQGRKPARIRGLQSHSDTWTKIPEAEEK
jgi:hypothetical protein